MVARKRVEVLVKVVFAMPPSEEQVRYFRIREDPLPFRGATPMTIIDTMWSGSGGRDREDYATHARITGHADNEGVANDARLNVATRAAAQGAAV